MERINAYKALDGKIFNSEDECRDYEYDLTERALLNNIKFYDSNNNLINIKNINDIEDILCDIHKVIIPTEEDCSILNDWLEECCVYEEYEIYFPTKGIWYLFPITTITSIKIVSENDMIE